MLIAIAGVFKLGAAFKELESQLIGLTTHYDQKDSAPKGCGGVSEILGQYDSGEGGGECR
jgi:hypothetical protein